ncbi:hypothetical protein [Paenibacillus radicis (ex Gao et al. 2016)]|uniref:Uncharacterized protein n=1 Tax=Paenibacillus radicis (ex Gao et al. 2016) TaxID=1737354 RepID=A0A917M5Z1_9BACL|nr:hypothetical protein [Paenibacillus radicis (ex Gao et al. 2016)]GGG77170.1 hypothetical protein GCM10010918_37240 [Paenibacillus radicis (ex Gao et al. 2016)]
MISRRNKLIIIGVLILLMLAMVVSIHFSFKGTPWGRANFTQRTEQYLSKVNYNFSSEYKLSTVHSFKTGEYKSIITLPSGIQFEVLEDYSNNLFDNYYVAKVEHTVSNEASEAIRGIFDGNPRVTLHIGGGKDTNKKLTESSSYTNLNSDIKTHATFYVKLENKFTFTDESILIEQCSKFIKWIKTNNYDANVFISFNDGYVINIRYDELRVIKDGDVLKHAVKIQTRV